MPTTLEIELTPEQYHIEKELYAATARKLGIGAGNISHIEVLRRSLDSRRGIRYHATLEVYRSEEVFALPNYRFPYKDCHNAKPVVIVGAGPAGLFAALKALELGFRPIVADRGKPVERRKLDIAQMAREKKVNPESNWCFGEGGAGTYSDGKLYTRSTKRGNVEEVLKKFVEHGADRGILIDAHAHIGTDRLSGIVRNMRNTIEKHGGTILFETRMSDILVRNGCACGIIDNKGNKIEGIAVILATGHSARDIYYLFAQKGWALEAKPFALGVRVEHPQSLINNIQYHTSKYSSLLPPASYSLTAQANGHGVFSFCMCPGGVIVPAATGDHQQVVNGMSNAHRNSPFANSGIAVTVSSSDIPQYESFGPLSLLRFQEDVERKVFETAGNSISAPSQKLTDFCQNRFTRCLNKSNYLGDCISAPLHEILPRFVVTSLQQGFSQFDRKMHGFLTEEASLLAVESRTSSPVRIPRTLDGQYISLPGLYPCGEGAGYAGGIVSSALDGTKAMQCIASTYNNQ